MVPRTSLRLAQPSDQEFLLSVFLDTRPDLTSLNLPEEQKDQLLRLQFRAQHDDYVTRYPDASFLIVFAEDVPIGSICVNRGLDEIRIVDIALLPMFRNRGIGARLIGDLIDEARRDRMPVRLYVDQRNPAIQLYQRLGFVKIGDIHTHFLMEWSPPKGI